MKTTNQDQEITFVNENAEKWYHFLNDQIDLFIELRKGAVFRGIVFNIADTFPEDKFKLRSLVVQKEEIKGGGGAKITRASDQNLNSLQPPCEGCPGSAGYTNVGGQVVAQKNASTKKATSTIDPELNPFESEEDIMDRFQGKANAMIAFCQTKDIELHPSIKKASTIAKYIMEHYQSQEDQEELQEENSEQ